MIALADLGEQLAWLGAACQASKHEYTIQYMVPEIVTKKSSVLSFEINFQPKELLPEEQIGKGTCWHRLVRNPVIASGFPILARNYDEKGLEIPVDMMAALVGENKATVFGDQLLIKGFSAMFVPTKQTPESILWHFLFRASEDERISYLAAKTECLERATIDTVDYQSLTTRRTFLGWASSTNLYTGRQALSLLPGNKKKEKKLEYRENFPFYS
jgi:hypothetical protein